MQPHGVAFQIRDLGLRLFCANNVTSDCLSKTYPETSQAFYDISAIGLQLLTLVEPFGQIPLNDQFCYTDNKMASLLMSKMMRVGVISQVRV